MFQNVIIADELRIFSYLDTEDALLLFANIVFELNAFRSCLILTSHYHTHREPFSKPKLSFFVLGTVIAFRHVQIATALFRWSQERQELPTLHIKGGADYCNKVLSSN
jgi:hypothetical protein